MTRSTATHVELTAHLLRQSAAEIGSTINVAPVDCVLLRIIHVGLQSPAPQYIVVDVVVK